MANTTNLMTVTPTQPTSPARTNSQSTQPRYRPQARVGKRNFSSTFDQINAKLDELKQGIKILQGADEDAAPVEADAPQLDEATVAQGKSENPQEAKKAIRNEKCVMRNAISNAQGVMRNDSEIIAQEEVKPADIFLGVDKIPAANNFSEAVEIDAEPQISKEMSPTEKLSEPIKLENVDEQSVPNLLAPNTMNYFFAINTESLLKPVVNTETVETPSIEGVQEIPANQNLQSLLPQSDNKSAQSMLNLLGGSSWRVFDNQPTIQAQPVKSEPVPIQPSQPTIPSQSAEVEAVPIQISQPTIQAQPVEVEAVPIQTLQSSIPSQPVEIEAVPIQISQPQIPSQPVEDEPVSIQTSQPQIPSQPVEVEAVPIQTSQSTIPSQPVEVEAIPIQISQPQIPSQSVEVEAVPIQTSQPTILSQPVEVEAVPIQISQPTIPSQPVESEAVPIQTSQPQIPSQPVEDESVPIQISQSTIPSQPAEDESVPIQTLQPTIPSQPVESEPVPIQTSQPIIPSQPVEVEAVPIQTSQPQIQAQPVEIEPAQVQAAQPSIQAQNVQLQQKIDERPALQNFSELLGVDVQIEEAPTSAPVTPPQSTPQQFEQNPQQQNERNFQQPIFQPVVSDEAQPLQVVAGGEVFAANLAATSDAPQAQPVTPPQALDEPPMPQDDFEVPAQIVRQARLFRAAENTEMVIKLNPEHLGELTLRVSVSANGAVNASFHSDNAQVRTIIENSLVQLRHDLNNVGLKVENVQVYAGLSDGGGLMNGQGGQAWQQNRQSRQGNRRLDFDSLERDVDATAPVNESTDATGVDYSV